MAVSVDFNMMAAVLVRIPRNTFIIDTSLCLVIFTDNFVVVVIVASLIWVMICIITVCRHKVQAIMKSKGKDQYNNLRDVVRWAPKFRSKMQFRSSDIIEHIAESFYPNTA